MLSIALFRFVFGQAPPDHVNYTSLGAEEDLVQSNFGKAVVDLASTQLVITPYFTGAYQVWLVADCNYRAKGAPTDAETHGLPAYLDYASVTRWQFEVNELELKLKETRTETDQKLFTDPNVLAVTGRQGSCCHLESMMNLYLQCWSTPA